MFGKDGFHQRFSQEIFFAGPIFPVFFPNSGLAEICLNTYLAAWAVNGGAEDSDRFQSVWTTESFQRVCGADRPISL
jgi:hypothetical protein